MEKPFKCLLYKRLSPREAVLVGELITDDLFYAIWLEERARFLRPLKRVPRYQVFATEGVNEQAEQIRKGW